MAENEDLEAITVAEVKEFLNFLDRVEEVKVVRLQPGDVIVCKTDDRVTVEGAERVKMALNRVFPGHELLITSGCSIEVARPTEDFQPGGVVPKNQRIVVDKGDEFKPLAGGEGA